ncbi:MAG: hypothetical protein V1735_07475 [Nanoarchaeota archaeon]
MNKLGTLLATMLFLTVFSVSATLPTVVNGHVYAADGHTPVPNVDVAVTCPEDTINTLHDLTNAAGYYVVEFMEGCNVGDTVEVCVGDICDSAEVSENIVIKNLVYINLSVPEFGAIAGAVAISGALLGFLLLRRK